MSLRSIVMQVIHKCAEDAAKRTGIDKPMWRAAVIDYLRSNEPTVLAEIAGQAVEQRIGLLIEEYIRSSRSAEVESLREIEVIKQRISEEQRIIQVTTDDGDMVAKPLLLCTAEELHRLERFYADREASDGRRKRFYGALATQLELGNYATVAEFLAA